MFGLDLDKERKHRCLLQILVAARLFVLVLTTLSNYFFISCTTNADHACRVLQNESLLFLVLSMINVIEGALVIWKTPCHPKYWGWRGYVINIILSTIPLAFSSYFLYKEPAIPEYMYMLHLFFVVAFSILSFSVILLLYWGRDRIPEVPYILLSRKDGPNNNNDKQ